MFNRIKQAIKNNPKIKKVVGILFVIFGIVAFITPLTPGSWLCLIGLELLGIRLLFLDKIMIWIKNKR